MGILGPCDTGRPGVGWYRGQWEARMCGEVSAEIGGWEADILGKELKLLRLEGEGLGDLAGV